MLECRQATQDAASKGPPPAARSLSREGNPLEKIKSIAVPVTRKRLSAPRMRPSRPDTFEDEGLRRPVRHAAPRVEAVHRYHIGERVRMVGGGSNWARSEAVCSIVALLPHERGPVLYRVQSDAENCQRVVEETDLSTLS